MAQNVARSSALVGGFVLLALAILVTGSLWLAGSTAVVGPRHTYKVLLHDSAGIETGDRVRVAGVAVGRVGTVSLQPDAEWPVVLEVSLKPVVDVRFDATATIASQGILGESFLQIDPGSPGAAPLPPGGEIPGLPPLGIEAAMARLDEMAGKLGLLLDQASGLLENTSARLLTLLDRSNAMLSEENAENLRVTLATLRSALETSGPRLSELLARLESASGNMDRAFEELPALTEKVSGLVGNLDAALGPDGERLAAVLDAAESGLVSADDAMSLFSNNRAEIEATLADLRDTVANLKEFSQQVKERPYSLVRIRDARDRKPGDGLEEDR